jgi:hypothetical protein
VYDAYAHAVDNANANSHTYTFGDSNDNTYSYAPADANRYTADDPDANSDGYRHAEGYAAAAPDAASSPESMMTNLKRLITPSRLRNILCPLFFIALGIAVLGAISSSRAITQRAAGSASSLTAVAPAEAADDNSWGRVDISAAAVGAPPAPTLSCPPCYLPMGRSEDFDNVIPPALPPDWIATNAQGPPPLWVTSSSGVPAPPADTLPNAAFIDDPAVVSDKRLDWLLSFAELQEFTFRHNFNLEASEGDPNLGFDGAVLEISFDGGNTFQDILDAGGSFLEGGYNRTISSDRGSPIAGRRAWSGNSHGFITTVVTGIGFSNGALRWRMASDNSGSSEGWRVDTVSITWCKPIPSTGDTPPCGSTPTPPITPTPTPPITPTPTVSPTVTPTGTPPPTPTATATPRATPRQRPTPHPRPSPP